MSISVMVNGVYRNVDTYPSNLNLDEYTEAPRKTAIMGTTLYEGFEIGGSTSWTGTKEFIILLNNKIVYSGKLVIIGPSQNTSPSVAKTDISGSFPSVFSISSYGFHMSAGFHIYIVLDTISSLSSQSDQTKYATNLRKVIDFVAFSVYYK